MRPETDIHSTDRYSVCKLSISSEKFRISQSSFESLVKVSKETFLRPFS